MKRIAVSPCGPSVYSGAASVAAATRAYASRARAQAATSSRARLRFRAPRGAALSPGTSSPFGREHVRVHSSSGPATAGCASLRDARALGRGAGHRIVRTPEHVREHAQVVRNGAERHHRRRDDDLGRRTERASRTRASARPSLSRALAPARAAHADSQCRSRRNGNPSAAERVEHLLRLAVRPSSAMAKIAAARSAVMCGYAIGETVQRSFDLVQSSLQFAQAEQLHGVRESCVRDVRIDRSVAASRHRSFGVGETTGDDRRAALKTSTSHVVCGCRSSAVSRSSTSSSRSIPSMSPASASPYMRQMCPSSACSRKPYRSPDLRDLRRHRDAALEIVRPPYGVASRIDRVDQRRGIVAERSRAISTASAVISRLRSRSS